MVLTDNNFATIARAVRQGRTLYDNILKFVRFQLSTTIGAILTQVDWAHFDHLQVGRARRPLMAFVMALSYSRRNILSRTCKTAGTRMNTGLTG